MAASSVFLVQSMILAPIEEPHTKNLLTETLVLWAPVLPVVQPEPAPSAVLKEETLRLGECGLRAVYLILTLTTSQRPISLSLPRLGVTNCLSPV